MEPYGSIFFTATLTRTSFRKFLLTLLKPPLATFNSR